MARMYPRTLHGDDLKSEAEGKVFKALEERLDDGWEVFHSMAWVVRDKDTGSDDGEIDFVLVHPEEGVLCLEVKGGRKAAGKAKPKTAAAKARKPAAKKASTKKTAARKTTTRATATKTAKKPAAKKTARKPAARKKPATRKSSK